MCINVNIANSKKIMYDAKMSVGTIMRSPAVPTAAMFAKVTFIIQYIILF